jgi:hypothetical protein
MVVHNKLYHVLLKNFNNSSKDLDVRGTGQGSVATLGPWQEASSNISRGAMCCYQIQIPESNVTPLKLQKSILIMIRAVNCKNMSFESALITKGKID